MLALRSRTHLEIIEGQVVAHLPGTQLFSRVREAAGKFVDFRGRERPITQIIDVRLWDRSASYADRSWRDTNAWLGAQCGCSWTGSMNSPRRRGRTCLSGCANGRARL